MGLALPAYAWLKERFRRHQSASTLSENQVTTVGQVLHLAIQGSPTGITVMDRTGDVVLSNARAHELGIVHERTVNNDVWRVVQETFDDKETHALDINSSANPRRPGNRVTAVQAVVKPLTLIDDRFVIVYATDESENVRMESARRDFVANVSHELKTPVGGMALLAEALIESVDDPEQVEYFGVRLHREAHRMADMINELISLSKLQGAERLPDMEPVKIDDIIDEAIERTQLAADNAKIELVRGDRTGVWVNAERSLLITALSNLISNAINYSPKSMPVSVSQNIRNNVVMIRVTDRGIGIAPEDQGRVFERFFRVDKARSRQTGGTGLGLAIVKHVMANHGGSISLWSRPGTGSTFTIELPVHDPESDPLIDIKQRAGLDSPLRSTASKVPGRRKEKT
ncbi:cell wall metabolism sensor histidine kinase WalK [uncultured Corynebacterium sp.]|uniref:sensor histidine kinase n=1 Tax=uncultured Corynebacterium sp. TaxID=159447 RepID=UPI0025DB84A8|nr:ATP-binding protein [uncultured Corynebacterium sp.]